MVTGPTGRLRRSGRNGRGQAFTLESLAASLLLFAGVVFALQATVVTPQSASTAGEHVENQNTGLAAGTLDSAAANGTLRPTLLSWNGSGERFYGSPANDSFVDGGPPTAFGRTLDRTLGNRSVVFNVNLRYVAANGSVRSKPLVHLGTPSDDAVRAARSVTLFDDDVLVDAAGRPTNTTLASSTTFYAPDAAPSSPVYNVVRVEVVAWRT